ncbi:MAG TPA: hypothetical protein VF070_09255 [Streptosporangiaceae bacterium]
MNFDDLNEEPQWIWPAALTAAGLILFLVYLRQARTSEVMSDGASNVMQAWDMLHGNLLLHGWTLSDVSFYTTELPQYMMIAAIRGLSTDVVPIAAAITYTLLVLGAALLAKGRAHGAEGATRALIAVGVMLAPSPGIGTNALLDHADHTGTQVPLIAVWLILDRAPRSWPTPVVVTLLLAWAQVADPLVFYEGALPIAGVFLARAYRHRYTFRGQRYEISLAGGALTSVGLASLILRLIHHAGGFTVVPAGNGFISIQTWYDHLGVTMQSVLVLFGADFSGQQIGVSAASALVHLTGVALVSWAFGRALRRFVASEPVVQVLVVAIAVLLVAYTVRSTDTFPGGAHEIAGMLPLGAALAGRTLAEPLMRGRHIPVMVVISACYAGILLHNAVQPAPPDHDRSVAVWLADHHLEYGLASYWTANAVTVDSAEGIQVRAVNRYGHELAQVPWESVESWYDPALHDARFLIASGRPAPCPHDTLTGWLTAARATFGQPASTYRVDGFLILVWNHNLLNHHLTKATPSVPTAC